MALLRNPAGAINSTHPAPDGSIIYFTGEYQKARWALSVSAAGGPAEPVYQLGGFQNLHGLAISPDGKWIVVCRVDEKGNGRLAYATPPGGPLQDYPHTVEWKSPGRRYLRFSPDSRRLLLVDSAVPGSPNPTTAYMLPWPPSEGAPRRVPLDRMWRMNSAWMPDGDYLLTASTSSFGDGFRLAVADQDLKERVPLTAGEDGARRFVSIHASGRALIAEDAQDINILSIPLDGAPLRSIGNNYHQELYPAWLPDGERFAGFRNRRGENSLWLFDRQGTPIRALVTGTLGPLGQAVSPDGRQIAFSAGGQLYVVAAAGGSPVRLVEGFFPSWSPDSEWLVFQGGSLDDGTLFKIRMGPNQKQQPLGIDRATKPLWSPDGKWIAYANAVGLHVVTPEGKGERKVLNYTRQSVNSTAYAWTKDSSGLYHVDGQHVLRVALDEKVAVLRELTDINLGPNTPNTASLSADGKTLLTTERRSHNRFVLLDGLHAPRRFYQRWWEAWRK